MPQPRDETRTVVRSTVATSESSDISSTYHNALGLLTPLYSSTTDSTTVSCESTEKVDPTAN